jgi:hypothetical protein
MFKTEFLTPRNLLVITIIALIWHVALSKVYTWLHLDESSGAISANPNTNPTKTGLE